ncbi:cobaltochelatase subunit CobN [Caldimicrobium thiodismutans]|nr:cobaltochelatase subunit CobN [Caldimicrobium thiodismutans]
MSLKNSLFLSLILFFLCSSFLFADQGEKSINIVVIPTSSQIKSFSSAREMLLRDLSERGLPLPRIRILSLEEKKDLIERELKEADLLLLNLMGRRAYERVKEYLPSLKEKKAFIFGLYAEGSYDEEMKKLGIEVDPTIEAYNRESSPENLYNLYLYLLRQYFQYPLNPSPVKRMPLFGVYDCDEKRVYSEEEFSAFLAKLEGEPERLKRPKIGLTFYRNNLLNFQTEVICKIVSAFREEDIEVIPAFGYPDARVLERVFLKGPFRIRALLGLSLKVGIKPEEVVSVLTRLNVPLFNLIIPYEGDEETYRNSKLGLGIMERVWQIFTPELIGAISPTIVGFKRKEINPETGEILLTEIPYSQGISSLVKKVKAYLKLQEKREGEKRIALIYYNYPPGKQNIGAAYLNVLPESIWNILKGLEREGYNLGEEFSRLSKEELKEILFTYGRNVAKWAPSEINFLAQSGKILLLPLETYETLFEELPKAFKERVIKDWGSPEDAQIMVYQDERGKKFFLLPLLRFGNILVGPQPSRAWEQNLDRAYHSSLLAPHHQYIAFYLYLRKIFQADAVIHLGTHGTLEWLPGREIGFLEEDDPEVLLGEIPDIYPYIVDDVGEGLQAKRRGMAVIIDHLVPPLKKSSLNPDLKTLKALLGEYRALKDKGSELSLSAKAEEILTLIKKLALDRDLEIDFSKLTQEKGLSQEFLEKIEDYLTELEEAINPYGLHTFGKPYEEEDLEETARLLSELTGSGTKEDYQRVLRESAERELRNLLRALRGEYISPGPGNDPIRSPESLPTGKNFFAFDPSRIPSPRTYELGKRLAYELLEKYREKEGRYPEKVAFVLWAVETIRHEGIMESQILSLLGVRPRWDERGRVIGLELIPEEELKRPRIDVVMTISGLYRDLFSNLVKLLDEAVSLALTSKEESPLKRNQKRLKEELKRLGVKEELAERLSRVRIFSEEQGGYGTGLDTVISASHTWQRESEVARVYIRRMSFLYGQGFWGEPFEREGNYTENLKEFLFKRNLSGTEIALHSRATQVFATLDNDDYFQYLGGLTLAIRTLDGKSPMVMITNLSDPKKPYQESLSKFMGREIRSRYLNPQWIRAMLKEGYAGARFIDKVVEHLFGFQVTNPEVVDERTWRAFYEVYVKDKYGLEIKKYFERAGNLHSYQSLIGRILEAIRKSYFKAEREIMEHLTEEYMETVAKVGLACCEHTCNNPLLTKFITKGYLSISVMNKAPLEELREAMPKANQGEGGRSIEASKNRAPFNGFQRVKGYLLEERKFSSSKEGGGISGGGSIPYLYLFIFSLFALSFFRGYLRR